MHRSKCICICYECCCFGAYEALEFVCIAINIVIYLDLN